MTARNAYQCGMHSVCGVNKVERIGPSLDETKPCWLYFKPV